MDQIDTDYLVTGAKASAKKVQKAEDAGGTVLTEDAWRTLAIASLAGLALLVVSLLLALVVPRLLKARDRRVRSALLAQHLVDDDAYSDVSFVELRSREGNGPLTST